MSFQTVVEPFKLHRLSHKLLDIRKHIGSYSTLEWLEARETNMAMLKKCIATKHMCHVEDIDIGVAEEMLLCDLILRINTNRVPLGSNGGDSEVEDTIERMHALMANITQFGMGIDHLCPELDEVFCVCLHNMVYATVDIMEPSSSLPTVEQMKCIMKESRVLHATEVQKKELAVHVLADAYRKAKEQKLLVFLPNANRKNVLLAMKQT